MAKDPAFLFYPGDWQGGTLTMSRHIKGCYIDLLVAQFHNGPLSLDEIKTVLGNDFAVWGALSKKFKKSDVGLFFNERLEIEKQKRSSYTESRRQSKMKADEDNVRIYLIKDSQTSFTKIGSSVNPQRRLAEMIGQKNPAITVGARDYVLIWHSEPTERKIEKTIHDFFKEKKVTGEWFNLTQSDIQTLIRTFFRTSLRTENENENGIGIGIVNDIELLKEYENWTNQIVDGNDQYFEQMFMNEHIPQSPNIQFWIMDHRDLLNRYPKMRPPNQDAFRKSCLKHIRENYKKPITPNGATKKEQHAAGTIDFVAKHYGSKPS